MSALPAFLDAHRDLLAALGEPATYAPAAGGSVALMALLDQHTAEVGEYGQTVAYRPAVSVLNADVPRPEQGDLITFVDSVWQVMRKADADDVVTRLWVEAA